MSITLGGSDGMIVDMTVDKIVWDISRDLAPVIAKIETSLGHKRAQDNLVKLTATLGGGKIGARTVAARQLFALLPLSGDTPMLTMPPATGSQTMQSILDWMVSVMSPSRRQALGLGDGLPWPAAAPFDLSAVPVPSFTLAHPIPGFSQPSKGPAAGLRLGLNKVKLPFPGLSPQDFAGDLVDGSFALKLPLGSSWQVKGIDWLQLKDATATLLLGPGSGACNAKVRLQIAGRYPLTDSKQLDLATTQPLQGGSGGACSTYNVAFDGKRDTDKILAFSDLAIVALNVVEALDKRKVGIKPDVIAQMMQSFDVALKAPSMRMSGDGFAIAGSLYVGGSKLADVKGQGDKNGFQLAHVDLSKIDLKIPNIKPWDAKTLGVDLGLNFFIATPDAPFMMEFSATAPKGRQSRNAFGIPGLKADNMSQRLQFGATGSLFYVSSGTIPLAGKKTVEISSKIGVSPMTGPSASITGITDSLTQADLRALMGKGANLKGFEKVAFLPVVHETSVNGSKKYVSLELGTSSFGFSGKLMVDKKEWGQADVTIGLPVLHVKGTAKSVPIGGVTFKDLALDGKAGVTLPYLRFCATAAFADPVDPKKTLTEKVKYFSGPPQGFQFDGQIDGMDVGFHYALGDSDLFDAGATMTGPEVDKLKDKLIDEIQKAGKPIKDTYEFYTGTVAAVDTAYKGVTDWVNKTFKPTVTVFDNYGMPTYKEAEKQCKQLLGVGGYEGCRVGHSKTFCDGAKSQCNHFHSSVKKYGASKVKKWFAAHSQSQWNSAGMETESYKKSSAKKKYDAARADRSKAEGDVNKAGGEDKVKKMVDALDALEKNKDALKVGFVGFDLNPKGWKMHVKAGIGASKQADYYVDFKTLSAAISELGPAILHKHPKPPRGFRMPPKPAVDSKVAALACPKF